MHKIRLHKDKCILHGNIVDSKYMNIVLQSLVVFPNNSICIKLTKQLEAFILEGLSIVVEHRIQRINNKQITRLMDKNAQVYDSNHASIFP